MLDGRSGWGVYGMSSAALTTVGRIRREQLRRWSQGMYALLWLVKGRRRPFDLKKLNELLLGLVHTPAPSGVFSSVFPLWAKKTVSVNVEEHDLQPAFDGVAERLAELLIVDLEALFDASLRAIAESRLGKSEGDAESLMAALTLDRLRFRLAYVRIIEMICVRNCSVHAQRVWSERARARLANAAGEGVSLPDVGSPVQMTILHVLAYKSAVRTVLNQCEHPTSSKS